jgi:hypothetical protein
MKTMLKLAAVLLLAVMIIAAAAMQSAIKEARAEQQNLLQPGADAGVVQQNNVASQPAVASDEAQRLRDVNKDLPKLRNEVRQLRRQAEEMEKLRADNEWLKNAPKPAPRQYPPDFIKRDALVDAGLATPEATVQTAMWAMVNGNLRRMKQCATAEGLAEMGQMTEEQFREQAAEAAKVIPGFRITDKGEHSPDEVWLTIEVVPGVEGSDRTMKLKRVGNEWKLESF